MALSNTRVGKDPVAWIIDRSIKAAVLADLACLVSFRISIPRVEDQLGWLLSPALAVVAADGQDSAQWRHEIRVCVIQHERAHKQDDESESHGRNCPADE